MKKQQFSSSRSAELLRPELSGSQPSSASEIRSHFLWETSRAEEMRICLTCGTHYPSKKEAGDRCSVCLDDRQYIRGREQQWTSYADIASNHSISINSLALNLFELQVAPSFAIDNRALLLVTPHGNILWDCIPFLDIATLDFVQSKGGLTAIAISHPHYYSFMHGWAKAFDCPIYLHQADQSWVQQKADIIYWHGKEKQLIPELKLLHIGGHFAGSAILHWSPAAGPKTILVGDTIYLSRNQKHLSAMYSFPNVIPLPNHELSRIFKEIDAVDFDRLFGAFEWQNLYSDAKKVLRQSYYLYAQLYPFF